MDGISHHLIDIKEPDEPFSVAEFQDIVRKTIDEIHERNRVPMIVGGTGLYIQSVIYDYQFSEAPSNESIRQKYEKLALTQGNLYVYQC